MSQQMIPIWSPADYWEAFEQAMAHTPCLATLSLDGEHYNCDNTAPHTTHTSAALRARWVAEVNL